jgi:protoporphyrinogen IX oxidase
MSGWLGGAYFWVKAAHVIFVIFWMAGLFMLPRFFVYHQESEAGSTEDNAWVERERRLIRIILNPSLVIVWVFGLMLAFDQNAFAANWFWLKLIAVLGLTGYAGWMNAYAKKLANGERRLTGKSLRLINEVPGIAATIIVILVIVKPF